MRHTGGKRSLTLHRLTAHEASEALRKGEISSRELTESVLERIETVEDRVRALVTRTPEEARAAAARIDEARARGEDLHPMAGIPIVIKDNHCTIGVRTTCSSRILEGFVPPYDATVVTRLKEAGAVMVGKSNLDEFAMGSSTENSGFEMSRNPWNLECVPGGSSGGSAAAMAADEGTWSTGSDTGGSIRQPASLCGVVGLRPTYGLVSRYGLVAFASSLDQIGPITKDVMDTALLLEIMAGADPMDATCIDAPVPRYHEEMKGDIEGLRLGIPKEYFVEGLDPEVKDSIEASIRTLEGLGARAVEISLPHTDYAIATYYVLCTAEASSNLARYDGVVYSSRKPGKDLVEMYMNTRREGFGDEVIRRIMLGTYVLSAGFYDAYYLKGQRVRTLICRDFDAAFENCDVILTPTSPTGAWKKGEKADDPLQMYLSDVFTTPSSLAGVPGISIPCGFTKDGLPIGLQIIGKVLDETTVLRTAWAFEQATDHHTRKAPLENGS